jgi:acetylornithine deacetylase/succinyl-diaminopimelate desuccinylase-like protein
VISEEQRKRRHRNERIIAAVAVLLIAAFTIWVAGRSRELDTEVAGDSSYIPKPTVITPEVELLRRYIQFDTSNPPGHELPAAEWLAGLIRASGIEAEVIETAPGRANVYARIAGRSRGGGLLLLHHIDVAPATESEWTHPPFAAEVHLDQLYGRGAIDMKGVGILFLSAFLDAAGMGRQPEHDLVFLAAADEETGGRFGVQWLLKNRPDIFEGVEYALNEGGITEMSEGQVTYYGVELGTKIHMNVDVVAPTREQLQRVRKALEPSFTPEFEPDRVLPEVRRFFADIAPHRIEFRDQLADIEGTIKRGRFWRLPIGYRELTQNNVFAYEISPHPDGGHGMKVALLNLPDEDPRARLEWLRGQIAPHGAKIAGRPETAGPVPISSVDTPLYELIIQSARSSFRTDAGSEILNRSYSDSRYLRQRGIEAYGISAFPVDFFQSESIHRPDERLRVEWFNQGIEFVRGVVRAYLFGK